MGFDPRKHHRRSIRLPGYDYAGVGAYFVTVCAHGRRCLFGNVADGAMRLNAVGAVVAEEWARTAAMRPRIGVDAFVVMPNHLHGVLVISDDADPIPPDGGGTLGDDVASDGRGTLQRRGTSQRRGTLQRAPTTQHAPATEHAPTREQFGRPTPDSIPTIVRLFKSATTKRINALRGTPGAAVWQRNYYEHVIRDEDELNRFRAYIESNPARWAADRENPDAKTQQRQPHRP